MEFSTWLLYLAASIGLSASPGPNGLLALTHGAMHGSRKALNTISGGVTGFVTVIALSMFGIGALLQTSIVWLSVLKWLGGAYLVFLGIQVWRSPPIVLDASQSMFPTSALAMFRQGLLSAVTNPKALLFFAAFLPQFINPQKSILLQFFVMAGTFALVEMLTEYILASMANRLRPWLRRVGKRFNQVCGGTFIAVGLALPLRS
jgi:homoserine/homoserine lactone efflux protein